MKHLFVVMIIFKFFVSAAYSQSLYVSTYGNDSNAGTSISSALRTIQKSLTLAMPGTTIYILKGTYNEKIFFTTSGKANNFITLKNYDNDEVLIDGFGKSNWGILGIHSVGYIHINGLNFMDTDTNNHNWQPAITLTGTANNIKISNCKFTNLWNRNNTGIQLYGNDTTVVGLHDIMIDSCKFGNNNFRMVQGVSITGNVYNCIIQNSDFGYIANQGISVLGYDSVIGNRSLDFSRNVTIKKNTIHHVYNKKPGKYQQGIIVSGSKNCLIERNRIYECDFGINIAAFQKNCITNFVEIRNNLIYKNYLQGISIGVYDYLNVTGKLKRCNFHNNTLYQNDALKKGAGEITLYPFDSSAITNNIFYCNNQNTIGYNFFYGVGLQNNLIDYNLYFSPIESASNIIYNWDGNYSTSFGYYKTISSCDLHGQYANPKFVNEYDDYPTFHLYNGSAAIDAGNPMFNAAFGETDFDGQNRVFNNLVDIGADENYNDFDQPSLSNQTNLETPRAINIYPSITCAVINCTTDEMIVCSDIEIKNVTGQVVNNYTIASIANNFIEMNVSQLQSGIYFISYHQHCLKFVKQ